MPFRARARVVLFGLVASAAVAQSGLEARLAAVLADARAVKAKAGAIVLRIEDGRPLFAAEADLPLVPASNQKVLTCAAAALALGFDGEMRTEFSVVGKIEDGVLRGALRARGEGDPTFGASDFGDSLQAFRAVADRFAARGLKRVEGDLLLDDSAFDEARVGPDWPDDAPTDRWMAPTAALSADEATVRLVVRPGRSAGAAAEVEPSPDTGAVRVNNQLKTVRTKEGAGIGFERLPNGDLAAKGGVRIGAGPVVHEIAVADPALHFGYAWRRALADAGIAVTGKVRRATPAERADGEAWVVVRTPLSRVFPRLLKESQNHRADMVFRHLGYKLGGLGSFENGGAVLRSTLHEAGVPTAGVVAADGSGLSRRNRVTARALASALLAVDRRPEGPAFREMLAEPGEDGTLERRLPSLKDRLYAKTGSIDGVSSLSGFLRRSDAWVIFAVIYNGPPSQGLRRYSDGFAEALARP
jgi:D-alanyl-D-alanine carboxypeptidase/D-alanyl-D-alanine-endopeptidase (penicillin-binding protein 4)